MGHRAHLRAERHLQRRLVHARKRAVVLPHGHGRRLAGNADRGQQCSWGDLVQRVCRSQQRLLGSVRPGRQHHRPAADSGATGDGTERQHGRLPRLLGHHLQPWQRVCHLQFEPAPVRVLPERLCPARPPPLLSAFGRKCSTEEQPAQRECQPRRPSRGRSSQRERVPDGRPSARDMPRCDHSRGGCIRDPEWRLRQRQQQRRHPDLQRLPVQLDGAI